MAADDVETPKKATVTAISTTVKADNIEDTRPNLHRSSTAQTASPRPANHHRHSKRLSLNFPILVPVQDALHTNSSTSPTSRSPTSSSPYRNGTPSTPHPLASPNEFSEYGLSDGYPDFLTLVAGQERRVMELKEELQKAESVLSGLKKQWASFESKKKQEELRNKTSKLGSSPSKNTITNTEDEETRRREAREKRLRELGMHENDLGRSNSTNGKRNGQRVFEGRHTRALSLLQNNPDIAELAQNTIKSKSKAESSEWTVQPDGSILTPVPSESVEDENQWQPRPSISRQSTLQELIANSTTGAAQLNLRKTYKELATASRKSLPPGTDLLVKQGKQVYDGVSEGFWNFVEDIRQATVGDEAVNGTSPPQQSETKRLKSNKKPSEQAGDKNSKHNVDHKGNKKSKVFDTHKPEKDNFWKEFGIETPKTARQSPNLKAGKQAPASKDKDHESKSSTDSKCPPSLLADLVGVNEDDDTWDNWAAESPAGQRRVARGVRTVEIRASSEDSESEGIERLRKSVKVEAPSEDSDSEAISRVRKGKPKRVVSAKRGAIQTSWAQLAT